MWFDLDGDSLNKQCATEDCLNPPRHRLEVEGVGSDYCPNCKHRITALLDDHLEQSDRIAAKSDKESSE
jgi:hypothetical protein